jgi:LacI family transcriptional regulator/LacI family purine nucleotide synthesis repressor/LacI family repressor for deo operon, udp, cdd, tsx, nupC, and nupG
VGARVTIYQIAREADVSVSTVSRVLNGTMPVSAKKRRAVEAAIRRHDYRPSRFARNLGRGRSMVIGFILPDVSHPFFGTAFLGAENRALERGYSVVLGNTLNDNIGHVTNVESRLLQVMLSNEVDGIIMMGGRVNESVPVPGHWEEMRQVMAQVPVVTTGGRQRAADCPSVEMNETHGIGLAVNYLAVLGHRRIGFLGGVRGIAPSDERMGTLRDHVKERGLDCEDSWLIESGFHIEDGRHAMEALLQVRDAPTAVLCFNDLVAIGAIYAARKSGLRVPEELSIVGMDNIALAEYIAPRLTSVDLDARLQGSTAVDLLIDVIEGKSPDRNVILQPTLAIRDSCGHSTVS